MIDFAFNILGYHRLEADIVDVNNDSIKLAQKLGMSYDKIKYNSYKLEENYYNQKIYSLIKK